MFQIKDERKTNKSNSDFQLWTTLALPAFTHGGQGIENSSLSFMPKSGRLCLSCLTSNLLKKTLRVPDLVHRPTQASVGDENCLCMALYSSYHKSDTTLQQSVLCQLSFQFGSGSPQTSINTSKWGLNIIKFISNIQDVSFY